MAGDRGGLHLSVRHTRNMTPIRWYEFLGLCAVFPAALIGSLWLLGWLTGSDPLIDEIWRLRGQNSALRERLEQLETGEN